MWGAYGANGTVVPMTEAEVTTDRRYEIYWAAEALRAWAEGDVERGNRYLRLAVLELDRKGL